MTSATSDEPACSRGEGVASRLSARARLRRWPPLTGLAVALALAGLWAGRAALLTRIGRFLVSEDPAATVDVMVLSEASAAGDALEVARLYREGYAPQIIVPGSAPEPLVPVIQALGVPFLTDVDLAIEVLTHSGVPAAAVHRLSGYVDGTDTEVAAVAAYVDEHRPKSLLFITARTHTARARWLLRRSVPETTQILVRAPRTDPFAADAWWRSRTDSREVFTEYLRWFNAAVLGDPWAKGNSAPPADGSPD